MILRVQSNRSGFTLIELIISAGLMAIVLGSAYACLSAGTASKRLIEARAEGMQSARIALNMIATDLRSTVPLPGNVEFVGMRRTIGEADADNVDFSTRNYNPKRLREPDYCEISYFLTRDSESDSFILVRRRDPTPDPEPLEGGSQEEIARGVRSLRFEYYDGFEWFTEWGDPEGKTKGMTLPPSNSYGLPEAVKIIIVFDPETKPRRTDEQGEKEDEEKEPMTFETIARLDLAPLFNRQAIQSQNANSGDGASQQAQPATEGVPQ